MTTFKFGKTLTETDVKGLRAAIEGAVNNGESFVIEVQQPGIGVYWHTDKIARELNIKVWDIDLYPGDNLSGYDIPKNTLVVVGRVAKGDDEEYGIVRHIEVFYNR